MRFPIELAVTIVGYNQMDSHRTMINEGMLTKLVEQAKMMVKSIEQWTGTAETTAKTAKTAQKLIKHELSEQRRLGTLESKPDKTQDERIKLENHKMMAQALTAALPHLTHLAMINIKIEDCFVDLLSSDLTWPNRETIMISAEELYKQLHRDAIFIKDHVETALVDMQTQWKNDPDRSAATQEQLNKCKNLGEIFIFAGSAATLALHNPETPEAVQTLEILDKLLITERLAWRTETWQHGDSDVWPCVRDCGDIIEKIITEIATKISTESATTEQRITALRKVNDQLLALESNLQAEFKERKSKALCAKAAASPAPLPAHSIFASAEATDRQRIQKTLFGRNQRYSLQQSAKKHKAETSKHHYVPEPKTILPKRGGFKLHEPSKNSSNVELVKYRKLL